MRTLKRRKPEATCPYCHFWNTPAQHCDHYHVTFKQKPAIGEYKPLFIILFLHPIRDIN